ncbi:hypothetical protein M3914_003350 [Vibrio metschnikovii]|uniref:hypothetical protein n=1 Tax=unclassified Vibrio TaxID=2614977 RepID=UPI00137281A4|nr:MULTISPECIES: hypothetical protein [unclassified Vibrio]EKO3608658.1 hypothetical protein [Vibrio metschnikovii]EKO3612139.1 hypothetical protein [Vibrio metschnikovii]EKO3684934.1 hypothetical protein [Vibrio metschnikovii]EKO3914775.1 hypothetical protein [Vibrio metschnikovii]NAW63281.1 hypothetical protein [Vibrio sp. V31_P5A7T61]
MDTWSFIISVIAVVISLVALVKTSFWFNYKISIRQVATNCIIEENKLKLRLKFIFACSGNQSIYVDQMYFNQGEKVTVSNGSQSSDVKKLLKPGEIKEFILDIDSSEFKHDQAYTMIFTLLSSNSTQSHLCLTIRTKPTDVRGSIINFEKLVSGSYSYSPLYVWVGFKQWRSRKIREQN